MKFPYTIGVERTAIPRVPFEKGYWQENTKIERKNAGPYEDKFYSRYDLMEKELTELPHYGSGTDDHCWEISSERFRNLKEFKTWFDRVQAVFDKWKLSPHHPDMVCGGGHIHVGVRGVALRTYMLRDTISRPYLPWVFGQPDEEDAMDNWIWSVNWKDLEVQRQIKDKACEWRDIKFARWILNPKSRTPSWYLLDSKNRAVRLSGFGTIEFRFFESPLDWSEQKDQLDFLVRYLKFMKKNYDRKEPIELKPMTQDEMQLISMNDAIVGFRKLLGCLRLPYSRYEKYVKRNLKPRWELDRKRL